IAEIATDKVDSEVPSPVSGILKERLFEENQVIQVGQVIALIETEGEQENETPTDQQEEDVSATELDSNVPEIEVESEEPEFNIPGVKEVEESNSTPNYNPSINTEVRFYSPLVRNIAQQEGISQQEMDLIVGTGDQGRVTKLDIIKYLETRNSSKSAPVMATEISAESSTTTKVVKNTGEDEIIEMDRMRRLIA